MYALPGRVKHWASLQAIFDCLRFPYTKGTQRFCGGVEAIGVHFQQQSVTGPTSRKQIRTRTITNRFATYCFHETGSGGLSWCLKSSRSSTCVTELLPLPQFNLIESSIHPTLI